jgi:hypothetical protein
MPKDEPFKFQTLIGRSITYSDDELTVIEGLKPLEGGEWTGVIKETSTVRRMDRDALKDSIKAKLIALHGRFCIYCGLHEDHCGSILQREHIAPKGTEYYPSFMFEPENLALACYRCNVEFKGETDVGSGDKITYADNDFSIVHPYLDNFHDHIELGVRNGQALIRKKNDSDKGHATIKMFELDSPARTMLRSGLLINNSIDFDSKFDKLFQDNLNQKIV